MSNNETPENETTEEFTDDKTMMRLLPVYMLGFEAGLRSVLVGERMKKQDGTSLEDVLEEVEKSITVIVDSILRGEDDAPFQMICNSVDAVWLNKKSRVEPDAPFSDRIQISIVEVSGDDPLG